MTGVDDRAQAVRDRAAELLGEDHGMRIAEDFDTSSIHIWVVRDSTKVLLAQIKLEWLDLDGGQPLVDAAIRAAAEYLEGLD
jgi:hypothetical protein